MPIVTLSIYTFRAPLRTPFVTSLRRVEYLEDIIVSITDHTGTTGWGEAAPVPEVTNEDAYTLIRSIQEAAPFLMGKTVNELLHYPSCIPSGGSGAVIWGALYDLFSKSHNIALYRFLNPQASTCILHSDITISVGDVQQTLDAIALRYQEGYRIFKLKLQADALQEAYKLTQLAKKLPNDILFRLDPNQAWHTQETIKAMKYIEENNIACECLEQPLKAHDIEGMRMIKNAIKTPLLADESAFNLSDAQHIIALKGCDAINIKLTKAGGIPHATKLVNLCRQHSIACMMGCMLEGPVAIASAAHFAAAHADVITMIDLDGVALLSDTGVLSDISWYNQIDLHHVTSGSGITPKQTSLREIWRSSL